MNTGDTRATWHGRGRLDSTAVIGPLQLRDVELVHAQDRCHDPARPGSILILHHLAHDGRCHIVLYRFFLNLCEKCR